MEDKEAIGILTELVKKHPLFTEEAEAVQHLHDSL